MAFCIVRNDITKMETDAYNKCCLRIKGQNKD